MRKLIITTICLMSIFTVKAQDFKIEDSQLLFPAPIVFETGTDKLKPESELFLMHIKQFLDAKTYITLLRIEGHSDKSGNGVTNQELTEKRALAVVKWLVNKGIDCKRLLPVGFGDTKPISEGSTVEGKAQNNRIEIRIAMLSGRAVGGLPVDGGGKVAGDSCK